MIRVSKIAHAAYETPDLARQTEYYTEIIGLTLVAQEKDTVYLASTVDHHSIVLRKGAQAQCTRVGLQARPRRLPRHRRQACDQILLRRARLS
jgi:catechol 2,3-dioxygenase-like lactoylglutathione lyase family enzyme